MTYVIGDIHGMLYTLHKLIDKIEYNDDNAEYVFVGDYFDRGLHSHGVIEYVLELQSAGAVCLRGNHDEVIDWIVNQHFLGEPTEWVWGKPTNKVVIQWWMANGLAATLESYGVYDHLITDGMYQSIHDRSSKWNNVADALKEKFPESHKKFIKSLPLYWENDTHFACHAYMRPDEAMPRSLKFMKSDRAEETLWSRFPNSPNGGVSPSIVPVWDKIGIFGHTPIQTYNSVTPIKHHNIRLIDTGAYTGEYLTAYCCERDFFITVAHDSRDIAEVKK